MSAAPLVFGFALLPPLFQGRLRHAFVALACVVVLHGGYVTLNGAATRTLPDYIAVGAYFRLGLVVPLVKAKHLAPFGLAHVIKANVAPLRDQRAREAQIWLPGGLVDQVRRSAGANGQRVASASPAQFRTGRC